MSSWMSLDWICFSWKLIRNGLGPELDNLHSKTLFWKSMHACNALILLWRNTFTSLSYVFKFPMKWDLRWGVSEVCGNVSLTIHTTALCSRLGQLTLSPELQGCKLHFASFSFFMSYHMIPMLAFTISHHLMKSQSVCTVSFTTGVLQCYTV